MQSRWSSRFSGVPCDNSNRKCETIQEAVNAAAAGDTINVKPGTYEENVVVPKRLTIQGAGKPTVDPVDAGAVPGVADGVPAYGFNLQANDIVIKGFRIGDYDRAAGGAFTDPDGSVGINTSSSFSGYKILNNTIEQNVFGVYLNTATSNNVHFTDVKGNTISDNNFGFQVLAAAGNGIYSDQGARKVRITENRFFGHGNEDIIFVAPTAFQFDLGINDNSLRGSSGIFLVNAQKVHISRNDIRFANFNGIELAGGNVNVTIQQNRLQNPGTQGYNGIYLNAAINPVGNTNNKILDNTVINAGLTGIRVRDSSFNVVKGNVVKASIGFDLSDPNWGNGIGLQNGDNNTVQGNVVKSNARHGIFVDADSENNLIKANTSVHNATRDPSAFDYADDSLGTGSGGTANAYKKNTGQTQNRPGLIQNHV